MKQIIEFRFAQFLLFSLLIFLFGCSTKANESQGYQITAYIKGLTTDTVYIFNTLTNVHESAPVKNERFSLKGHIEFPEMIEIGFDSKYNNWISLFLENSTISITGNIDSLTNVVIDGSSTNREMKGFLQSTSLKRSRLTNAENLMEEALTRDDYTTVDSLEVIINQIGHSLLEDVYNYASAKKNSAIIPYITLTAVYSAPDRTLVNRIIDLLDAQSKSNPRVAMVNKYLEDVERTSVGNMASDFEIPSIDGKIVRLSSYKGKVVILDFWASWCGPCIKKFPELKEVYAKFGNSNLEIIGFSIDKDMDAWKNSVNKNKLPWLQVVETKGANGAVPKNYGITFLPTAFLIDQEGKIVCINPHKKKMFDVISKLLN